MSRQTARFPRLLVVTDYTPEPVSGAALIRQLLRGFPREQVHWWCSASQPPVAADPDIGHIHPYPLPSRMRPYVRLVRVKSELVGAWWVPRAARHLCSTVDQVRPDQVWVQLTGWAIPAFARSGLIRRHRCHVSIWDYQNTALHARAYGTRWARRLFEQSEDLYRQATTADAISLSMWEDLAARTGRRDAIVVHSSFESHQLEHLLHHESEATPDIRIAYVGSILVPEVFQFLLRGLDQIRRRLTRPVSLHLFGRDFRVEPWFNPEWMVSRGFVTEVELFKELERCAWGLALMNLRDDDDPVYRRYSFPNKIGTYLSAGLPLILLAHRDSSAARMFAQYPAGIYTDATEHQTLCGILRQALGEANPRQRFRDEIIRCAETEFNAGKMRCRLWRCFGMSDPEAAEPPPPVQGGFEH